MRQDGEADVQREPAEEDDEEGQPLEVLEHAFDERHLAEAIAQQRERDVGHYVEDEE